jgi:hypothetical protein
MIRNIVCIDHQIGNQKFEFICEHDASTTIIKEALCHYMKVVGQIEDQVNAQKEQMAQAPVEGQPVPEISPEEPKPEEV